MANKIPRTVFLAGSTVEVISALTCIVGLGIQDAVVFVERNISFGGITMDRLLDAARTRFLAVRFVELSVQRSLPETPDTAGGIFLARRRHMAWSIRQQLDAACRNHWSVDLNTLGAHIETLYFTALHDYVTVFLAACPRAVRVFYPHGFDHPRRQHVREYGYLVGKRSLGTMLKTIAWQKKYFGKGGLMLGLLGRLLPGTSTVCLPFTGVDQVLTFRSGIDYIPNELMRVPGLEEMFHWLMRLPPWADLLRQRQDRVQGRSLLLLLGEYNYHPIWEKNCNYGSAHLQLLQMVSQTTGLNQIVLKAHVRSDGSAAVWLAGFLQEQEPGWNIEILPAALSGLPVEALALTGEFGAACSLGSCSLPPGLGFGITHYVSPTVSEQFDLGWNGLPHMTNSARMLIREGICRDIGGKPEGVAEGDRPAFA